MDQEIIVAGDIHVAEVWDSIAKSLEDTKEYLNPNEQLRKLISQVTNTQLLILNGDLIDYHYSEYQRSSDNKNNERKNNWEIFWSILKDSQATIHCNLGNHDYRSHPYNFSFYKLLHVNIANSLRKALATTIGFHSFRFLKEIRCITVNMKQPELLKNYPYNHSHHIKKAENKRLLFLTTGPDALTELRAWYNVRKWKWLLTADPAARGLTQIQLDFVVEQLELNSEPEVFLFIHSPLFFSIKKIPQIKITPKNPYSKMRRKHKLTHGCFLKGNEELFDILQKSTQNMIVVNSHIHIQKQYTFDKESQVLSEASMQEINLHRQDPKYIKFISTLALGAISPYCNKIGYLKIGKNIEHVVVKTYTKKKEE